ncbi:MAG TPA: cytochrome c biogenesis heme-transporting ATPase CcmA [Terriglobales bacterium]|nr:cytochrome c biogenesis heme-transporting ATPase CcmA [Terriglobales bacterium]
MLRAINLGCIRGDRRLFRDLNFQLSPGEVIELRGPNGTGKTSLLRILCGLATPAEGEVRWQDKNIRSLGEEYHSDIAYLAHQNGVKDELSAIENVRIASALAGHPLTNEQAKEKLAQVGLSNYWHLPARMLSAGQRRRIGLARLLAARAKVWILDEVLASLDEAAINLTRRLVTDHLSAGGLAIIATHQELALPSSQRLELGL